MTSLLSDLTTTPYDVAAIRRDFAVLSREVNGRPLVYLDNASSSHKPRQVLDAERAFVEQHYSNVHRGVHTLSQEATDAYEEARATIAILDETDSGLDIDALRVVSEGVNRLHAEGNTATLLITHYTRILRYIKPDFVHVFVKGRIVEEGGRELADELEANGYDKYVSAAV